MIFSIRCATKDETKFSVVDVKTRLIKIEESRDVPDMVDGILFELNNLKKANEFISNVHKMCSQDMDDFAIAQETLEYGTSKNLYQTSLRCFQHGFWPKNLIFQENKYNGQFSDEDWRTLEGYLRTQDITGHTDHYRSIWKRNCGLSESEFNLMIQGLNKMINEHAIIPIDYLDEILDGMNVLKASSNYDLKKIDTLIELIKEKRLSQVD